MKKSAVITAAVLAGLMVLTIAVGTVRTGRMGTAQAAAKGASGVVREGGGAGSGARGQLAPQPIRLASNPQPIPPFLVNDLNGEAISTAAWRGKVVLLNFWATWCGPCRLEIPELIELADRYKDQLQVVGISMDDGEPDEVRAFAKKIGVNYPIIMASREIVRAYGGVPALPTTFVVSPDGGVVQKHVGLAPSYVYEDEARALLKMPVSERVETFEDHGQIFLKNAALATELPGVEMKSLTAEQRKAVLRRLNSEGCDCGCKLTLAQCRVNDTACPRSEELAKKIVDETAAAKPVAAEGTAGSATN